MTKQAQIEKVTILEKKNDIITKLELKYNNSTKLFLIEDEKLIKYIMLFWVAKCIS